MHLKHLQKPLRAHAAPNVTSIKKKGRDNGCPTSAGRRKHQDKATESEEEDATPDLL
jgi:hypothetical protein